MDQPSPYKTYISKTVPMLENLTGYYKAADGQTKKKIPGCIFTEKLVFEKGRVATTPFEKCECESESEEKRSGNDNGFPHTHSHSRSFFSSPG